MVPRPTLLVRGVVFSGRSGSSDDSQLVELNSGPSNGPIPWHNGYGWIDGALDIIFRKTIDVTHLLVDATSAGMEHIMLGAVWAVSVTTYA